MQINRCLCILLLATLCCIPAVSASGMVKFHIPAVENAKVGDTVTVTLYNDNNLKPLAGDLSIYLDWNMEVLKYESSTFKQGHTTAAELVGLHNLNIMAADTANGFPQGDNPLIVMKFKVIGPGYTPIVIKVDSLSDVEGTDILAKAVVSNGAVTATGTALPTGTGTTPTTVTTTVPGVTVVTPVTTLTPIAIATTTAAGPVSAPPVASGPATVPFGTGVFSVTSLGNVPVGGTGTVQVVVDNAWQPLFSDTYVDVTFDPTMISYTSSSIHLANTTAASKSDGRVRIMLGDFRNGYPDGRYAIADVTFTALREGTTPLTVSVDHVRYWNSDFTKFTDISTTASTQSGSFSTGPVQAAVPTLAPVTPNPAVTYETTLAPIGTVQTVVADSNPVSAGSVNRDSDEYTGVVTKTATPTPTPNLTANTTVATAVPTTVNTTVPTTVPTTVNTTVITTVPTTIRTTQTPTPTPTKSALPFGVLALAALAGVALVMARTRR
ncbi:MAG: hypothetical protein ABFC89_08900 [Methanospirillum sp.]